MNKSGFVLVEAIASIVILSVCLTMISRGLLTNAKASDRFRTNVNALLAAENRLGLVLAASSDVKGQGPDTLRTEVADAGQRLKKIDIIMDSHTRKNVLLKVTTYLYEAKSQDAQMLFQ